MQTMCLSVRQPRAASIVSGAQRTERRTWYTSYRGALSIYSPRKADGPFLAAATRLGRERRERGVVIGVVELVDCVGSFDTGYALVLARPRAFDEPMTLPFRVMTKFFELEIPDALVAGGGYGPFRRPSPSSRSA